MTKDLESPSDISQLFLYITGVGMDETPPKPLTDDAVVGNRWGSAKVFAIFRVAVHHCFTDRTLLEKEFWYLFWLE